MSEKEAGEKALHCQSILQRNRGGKSWLKSPVAQNFPCPLDLSLTMEHFKYDDNRERERESKAQTTKPKTNLECQSTEGVEKE